MQFNHVDGRLTVMEDSAARKQFQRLLLELGIWEDNCHVGTGLGGNNFELLTLFALKQTLVKRPIDIRVDEDRIAWGAEWLIDTKLKKIRSKLDEVFPSIQEHFKYMAVALCDLSKTNTMRDTVVKYPKQFPHLMSALEGKNYRFDGSMSYIEQYIMACILCQELTTHLDQGDVSLVGSMGRKLSDFPMEIVLMSVRKYIQLERLVRYNLDEHPVFGLLLSRINREIN